MNTITTTATPLINAASLPGVARVEEVKVNGKPAMKVVFVDGIEATVTRAFMNEGRFDIWLPPDRPHMAASMMPKVDEDTVMSKLNELAAKAVESV